MLDNGFAKQSLSLDKLVIRLSGQFMHHYMLIIVGGYLTPVSQLVILAYSTLSEVWPILRMV
jgi:hypothetical protein